VSNDEHLESSWSRLAAGVNTDLNPKGA
jgi:hypothetical protein